jgi:diguanylate cyclase (GGDEF)-like protein
MIYHVNTNMLFKTSQDTRYTQRLLPWLILGIGLVITYLLQNIAYQTNLKNVHERFEFRANEIVSNIESRIESYKIVLLGAKGLFLSSQNVERNEFREYVRQLNLAQSYPGIQGVGFSLLIEPEDLAAHTQKIRNEGFPDYTIRPGGNRDVYTSIVYLEPFDWRNQRAFGYDMFSEPTRRKAMQQARDTNNIITSGKVTLVQETERNTQPGFLMYLPVYHHDKLNTTLDERRENILGWVYAPFRMHDLMRGIMGPHFGEIGNSIAFDIYDGNTPAPENLMYDFESQTGTPGRDQEPVFSTLKRVDIGGHSWTITVRSLPALESKIEYKNAEYIAISGVIVSLLTALIVWLLLNGRERAFATAKIMTQELRSSEAHTSRLNRALKLLSDCNMAMLRAENEQLLLKEICQMIVDKGGYLMAWVGYAQHDEYKTVQPMAEAGDVDDYLDSINVSWGDNEYGQGPTGVAIRTGLTDINQDYLNGPRMTPWRESALRRGYQSSISIPLLNSKGALGALTIYAAQPFAFSKDEVELLEELAADLTYGITTLRTRAEHKLSEDKITFLAYHDTLTKLPNQLLFCKYFNELSESAQQQQIKIGVVLLDLDNFKHVNDALGHSAGDQLLILVKERLINNLHETDKLSRIDSDKFVLLLNDIPDNGRFASTIQNIINIFTQPFEVETNIIDTTASIGISIFPNDGSDWNILLKKANIALTHAKDNGRNIYQFFTEQMNLDIQEQMELQSQLHNALKNQELQLYYQAQVSMTDHSVTGFEALLRWQHPQKGMIPPTKFIPLAERSGLIVPIGEWVLNEACRQAKVWLDHGYPLVMAVNLSSIQFKRGNLLETIAAALKNTGLPAHMLELELTESILLENVDSVMNNIQNLKNMGVKLSIDDFGTGYSSLSYLKRLAIDKLKIDQSFIADLATNSDDKAIVDTIIQLGHSLQLTVIAEGVENTAQLALLKEYGCNEAQGYYFSRPVPAIEAETLLSKKLS